MSTPHWLNEPSLQQLFSAVAAAGGQARVVGGAVRDYLLPPSLPPASGGDVRGGGDVDIACSLPPDRMMEVAAALGFKAIPTGIAHGTITLVLPERIVEITTLRRDVTTDGRHATVAYTDDFAQDAARRDFTINALSMDATGKIYDYFDGKKDIATQTLRFIGDAKTRITEDGLRILRFFRFLASHGKPPADASALAAIAANKSMLQHLSGERIAAEMKKLLSVENPAFALRLLHEAGVDTEILPHAITPARIIRLHMLEVQADYQTSVWARLALLLSATPADASRIAERWKLSRHEATQLKHLASLPAFDALLPRHVHTRMLRLHGAPAYLDWLLTQAALTNGIDTVPYVALAREFVPPVFPVTAADLMARGLSEGKALGEKLAALEKVWEESDYTLSKEELLVN